MSGKSVQTNSVRSGRLSSLHDKFSSGSGEDKIMLAADESKDRLYEPKRDKKMVRVLTVVVYVFSVSLAAIMLSLYYVFFWEPKGPHYVKPQVSSVPLSAAAHPPARTPAPRCLPHSVPPSSPSVVSYATEESTLATLLPGDDASADNTTTAAAAHAHITDNLIAHTASVPTNLLENETHVVSENTTKRKKGRDPELKG